MKSARPNCPNLINARWSGVAVVAGSWRGSVGREEKRYSGNELAGRVDALEEMVTELRGLANSAGVSVRLSGRVKSFESTWHKMAKRHIAYQEVLDQVGVRMIFERVEHCYQVLGRLHRKYRRIPGHERDYIVAPKENGYQSLHTTLRNAKGMSIEVQLRTSGMHERSEAGSASHQAYKGD
jgi:GTP pyrophosphokinase